MENLTDSSELIEAELVRNPSPVTHFLLAKGELVSGIVNLEAIIDVSRFSQFDKFIVCHNICVEVCWSTKAIQV